MQMLGSVIPGSRRYRNLEWELAKAKIRVESLLLGF